MTAQTDVLLQSRDGSRLRLNPRGAQLLSWQPAGAADQLFLSDAAAPRGGVPVVFPQFASQGLLPRHGLVRSRDWQLVEQRQDELALAVLRCESGPDTLAAWPHAFALELTMLAQGAGLEIELAVQNTGESAFQFQAALHSYLRVGDVAQCMVEGLRDRRYLERSDQGEREREGVQHSSQLELLNGRPVDRIVYGVGETPLALHDHSHGERTRTLAVQHQGFADAVIWNPGSEHGLADLPGDSWREFLCIEAAQIETPILLQPGDEWLGRQRLMLA
jgi:glucose-6-phosphate 1-epimerase